MHGPRDWTLNLLQGPVCRRKGKGLLRLPLRRQNWRLAVVAAGRADGRLVWQCYFHTERHRSLITPSRGCKSGICTCTYLPTCLQHACRAWPSLPLPCPAPPPFLGLCSFAPGNTTRHLLGPAGVAIETTLYDPLSTHCFSLLPAYPVHLCPAPRSSLRVPTPLARSGPASAIALAVDQHTETRILFGLFCSLLSRLHPEKQSKTGVR